MDFGHTVGRALRRTHVTLPLVIIGILLLAIPFRVYLIALGPLVIPLAGIMALALVYVVFRRPRRPQA